MNLVLGPLRGGPGQQAVRLAASRLVQGGGDEASHPWLVRYRHQMKIQCFFEIILAFPYVSNLPWEGVEESSTIDGETLLSEGLSCPPPPWPQLGHPAPPP